MYINSLNNYFREKYKTKVYKVSISGNMGCPNREKKTNLGGCIFCSRGGSGDFIVNPQNTVTNQIDEGIEFIKKKNKSGKYMAYFQSYTNTYEKPEYLKKIFTEAIMHEEVVGISIATRPDCIDEEKAKLLGELNKVKDVYVELGLQTINEKTANYIRRGYKLEVFNEAVKLLKKYNLNIVIHLIIGLPNETKKDVIDAVKYLNNLPIDGIKLQLLHVLKDTDLADEYYNNKFELLTLEEYKNILFEAIKNLRKDIVIHRITGDGPKKLLIGPLWSGDKKKVLNYINMKMIEENLIQGRERDGF